MGEVEQVEPQCPGGVKELEPAVASADLQGLAHWEYMSAIPEVS